jgi:GTP-binding protein
MADIPGLIEGAANGEGLGHDFLRHIERCRMLVHMVDVSGSEGRDPVEDFEAINRELAQFSPRLAKAPQIVAANKSDLTEDKAAYERLRRHVTDRGCECFEISAATTIGIDPLMKAVWEKLKELPPILTYESETTIAAAKQGQGEKLTEIKVENGVYIVEGDWLYNLLGSINFSDYESLQYLHRVLHSSGVYEMLEEAGISEGDTVSIYGMEFDYMP